MFAVHPLKDRVEKLEGLEAAEALRLAIIAELDAISFYTQIASKLSDESLRRVFLDVAREEKTHVGEFLGMLLRLDPEQVEELREGFKELEELTGKPQALPVAPQGTPPSNPGSGEASRTESVEDMAVRSAKRDYLRGLRSARILARILPSTVLAYAADYAPVTVAGRKGFEHTYVRLDMFAEVFSVDAAGLEASLSAYGEAEVLEALYAGQKLAMREEERFLEAIKSNGDVTVLARSDWGEPGAALRDVASALEAARRAAVFEEAVLLIPPKLYAELLAYHEKTGVVELERVKRMTRVEQHPLLGDEALLVPLTHSVVDIVYSARERLDYVGLDENGRHVFRGWEKTGLRIKNPAAIVRLTPS